MVPNCLPECWVFFEGHYRRLSHGLLICLLEARLILLGFMPLFKIMNPGVCTMSLFADYVKFYAKVEGQGMTLTFDTHVASFTHLVDCKYKIKSSQTTIV